MLPASKMPSGEPPYMPNKWSASTNILKSHNCYTYMLNDLYVVARINDKPQPGHFVKESNARRQALNIFSRLSCQEVRRGVVRDNPNIKPLSLSQGKKYQCPKEHYKGIMIMSPGNDYHFARQDNRLIPVYRALHKKTKRKQLSNTALIALVLSLAKTHIPEILDLAQARCKTNSSKKQLLRELLRCSRTWSHKPGGTAVTDRDAAGNLIIDPEKANWDYSPRGGVNYYITCCYYSIPNNNIAYTKSTGVAHWGSPTKDDPLKVRTDISTLKNIDAYYEYVLKKALR